MWMKDVGRIVLQWRRFGWDFNWSPTLIGQKNVGCCQAPAGAIGRARGSRRQPRLTGTAADLRRVITGEKKMNQG